MKSIPKFALAGAVALVLVAFVGCGTKEKVSDISAEAMPTFSLATSEYPSWSTFVVAQKAGLIGKEGGAPGLLEKKWGVRMKLEIKDYDPCLTMYAGGSVDAVCMTNMDALNPAMGRASTVIMPTSTSVGADKVIGIGGFSFATRNGDVSDKAAVSRYLQGNKTYGLAKSVSEFVWYRGLQKMGLDPKDYSFVNLEPAAAATALQSGSKDVKSICVWNPYALQTMRSQKMAAVLFDSSLIPEEVIDCVVMSNDSLKKAGGDKFACLIADVFYNICAKMDDPRSDDATYKALGEEFSKLSVADMRICCKETRFYMSPADGMKLFKSKAFQDTTMPMVVKTCQSIGVLASNKGNATVMAAPTIGYNDPSKNLNFDTTYMQMVVSGK